MAPQKHATRIVPKSSSHYVISLKNNIYIYKISAFPKKTNRGPFIFTSCQVPYTTDWRVKNVSEQQRLRRGTIINNMLMMDKRTAQGLQARPGAFLYFAVCEQGGKQSVSQKAYRMRRKERLHTKFLFIGILLNTSPTHAQIHTPPHICFFRVFSYFQICNYTTTIPQSI